MSNSDDTKDTGAGARKASGQKPVKRVRKRQASRPPTIEGKAVRLDAQPAKTTGSAKVKQDVPAGKNKTDTETTLKNKEKSKVTPGAGKVGSKSEAPGAGTEKNLAADGSGRFGYGAMALSAGVGGTVAVVLIAVVFGLQFFSSAQNKLENRLSGLADQVVNLKGQVKKSRANGVSADAVQALQLQVKELAGRLQNDQPGKLEQRIAKLETVLAGVKKAPIGMAEFKNLSSRLAALDMKIGEAKLTAEKSIRKTAVLEQAVKAAGETIKGSTDGAQGSIMAQNLRLAAVETQLKTLSKNMKDLQDKVAKSAAAANLVKVETGLRKDAGALETKVSTLSALLKRANEVSAASAATLVKIDQRLSKLEKTNKSDETGRLAALGFAIEGLVGKAEAGKPFERELDIVSVALPQNKNLKKLKAVAKTGVKSIAQLQDEFTPVLRAILNADEGQTGSGVVGKIVGTARSLIRIRRVGEIPGDSREAVIARLEARVKAGDMSGALMAARQLKGASAAAAKLWVQALEKRLKTLEIIDTIRTGALSGIKTK